MPYWCVSFHARRRPVSTFRLHLSISWRHAFNTTALQRGVIGPITIDCWILTEKPLFISFLFQVGCVCPCVCLYPCMCVYLCLSVFLYLCGCVCVYMWVCVRDSCVCTCVWVCLSICACGCMFECVWETRVRGCAFPPNHFWPLMFYIWYMSLRNREKNIKGIKHLLTHLKALVRSPFQWKTW